MSVVSLWEDKLAQLAHVEAVTRDYSVNPLIGACSVTLFFRERRVRLSPAEASLGVAIAPSAMRHMRATRFS